MPVTQSYRLKCRQQGYGVLKFISSALVLTMVVAVGYLLMLRKEVVEGPPPQPAPEEITQGPSGDPGEDDRSLTPEQLMELRPLNEKAQSNRQPKAATASQTSAVPAPGAGPVAGAEDSQPPSIGLASSQPLPPLDNSDQLVKKVVTTLDTERVLVRRLVDEELIRKFVVTLDNMAAGTLVRKHSVIKPLETPFRAVEQGDQLYVDGYNFRRYAPYIQLFSAIDADELVRLYRTYYPLMQQAYGELGYPRSSFHRRVLQAIDHILAGPVREGAVELTQPSVMYKFADPELEQLSDVHKQMLRMGPENSRQLINQLTLLRSRLVQLGH